MTYELPESWQLGSGLKDDYVMVVDHSYFGTDANYQDGKQLLLIWEGHDEEDGSEAREQYSIGKGWETPDYGRTITGLKKINGNSLYGRIVGWAVENTELRTELLNRGNPMTSAIWEGLRFHMKVTKVSFGRNLEPIERVMPVEFISVDRESSPAPSPSPAARGTFTSQVTSQDNGLQASTVVVKLLGSLAKTSDSFETFIEQALDIPEVMQNADLRTQLSDDSADGFYAKARA